MALLPKSSLTVETSQWTSSNLYSVPLHSSSRLWDLIFKRSAKFTLIWRGLWTHATDTPVIFKTLSLVLYTSLVQEWPDTRNATLVAHALYRYERGGSWCTDSYLSPLPAWQSSQGCGCCWCTFSSNTFSFRSTFYEYAWVQRSEQPAYLAMTFWGFPSLKRVSVTSAQRSGQQSFPMIVKPRPRDHLKAQETLRRCFEADKSVTL